MATTRPHSDGGPRDRGSARRREILDIAGEVFADQGVTATTVRQIGDRAGIQSGSLYHHFSSKHDIVDAILRGFAEDIIAGYREIVAGGADPLTTVDRFIHLAFETIPEHRAAILMVQSDARYLANYERFSYLREVAAEIERTWERVLRDGIDQGLLRSTLVPHVFYRAVYDAIAGCVRWHDPAKSLPLDALADEVATNFVDGIRPGR